MISSTGKNGLNKRQFIVTVAATTLVILAFFQWAEIQSLTQSLIQSQTNLRNLLVQVRRNINGVPVNVNVASKSASTSASASASEVDEEMEILKLNMTDPSLLTIIQNKFLVPPSNEPYKLKEPLKKEYPQYEGIVKLLNDLFPMTTKKERPRFFIEAGAFDGEYLSNTLNLERDRNWTGLLVEPNPQTFEGLKAKNRKAWLLNSCLSTSTKATKLTFEFHKKYPEISRIESSKKIPFESSAAFKQTVTCLPIFSILSAINVTTVDFFSLDVEGAEVDVLKTIPFDKIYIKVFLIEQWPVKSTQEDLINFMKEKKYIQKAFPYSRENFLFFHPDFVPEAK